ncbi:MFS transporter [Methanogenium cariaci]|uniref:MFS transporter n=1 Tax=Methanogenium cariaci TaxID=2197 RepID=UPI0007801F69|nr:MFS transporter [Methanogenium cariaci]
MNADPNQTTGTRKNRRPLIMAVTLLGMFMSVLDSMIIGIALPTITEYFHADIALSQWTMTAYLVAMTSTLLIFGKLSEYTGKERMFLAGMGVFTLASLGCALAPTLPMLIALRTVQGIGAAMAASIAMALIIGLFSYKEHGKAMGALGATIALASLTGGPVLGGFLIDLSGWESIFLINIPFGLLLLVTGGVCSMDLKKPATGQIQMDWCGAAGLVMGISGLMFFLGIVAGGVPLTAAVH